MELIKFEYPNALFNQLLLIVLFSYFVLELELEVEAQVTYDDDWVSDFNLCLSFL